MEGMGWQGRNRQWEETGLGGDCLWDWCRSGLGLATAQPRQKIRLEFLELKDSKSSLPRWGFGSPNRLNSMGKASHTRHSDSKLHKELNRT